MHIVLGFLGILMAEVTEPTSWFNIEALEAFYPGATLESAQKMHGKSLPYGKNRHRFQITHRSYKFPVFVQAKEGIIQAFWARLPGYFLHDPFHQILIDRYGKQKDYVKRDNSAVYSWDLPDKNLKLVYAGQCSITCFPLYLAGTDPKNTEGGDNLLGEMRNGGLPAKP